MQSVSFMSRFARGLGAVALAGWTGLVSVLAFSSSDQAPWVPIGMGGNGYIDDLDVLTAPGGTRGRYFVATGVDSGGVWVSFDEAQSFVPLGGPTFAGTAGEGKANGNVVKFVAADPTGRTVLVGTDSKEVFRSYVSPTTGELLLAPVTPPSGGFSQAISVFQTAPSDAQVMYAGGGNRRVYYKGKIGISESLPAMWKSTDAGQSWTEMAALPIPSGVYGTVCNIAVHPTDSSIVLAATDQGLYKFAAGSWTRLGAPGTNQLPHRAVFGVCFDPASTTGQIIYVTMMPYDDMETFLLTDAIPPGETGNRGGIYKSTDGGATWSQLSVGFTPPAGSFSDTGFFYNVQVSAGSSTRVYATYAAKTAAARGVLRSTNSGTSWTLVSESDPNVTLDYQGVFRPAILGVWAESSSNDHVFVTGDVASNYKSADSAVSFRSFTSSVSGGAYRGWGLEGGRGKYLSLAAGDPTKMFCADTDRGFWTSANGGTSWTLRFNPDNATQGKGRFILPDPDNASIVYAASAYRTIDFGVPPRDVPHFFKSTDGGATFSNTAPGVLNGVTENNIWDIALDPTVLASGSVDGQRIIYLSAGSKAQYRVEAVLNTTAKTYDVYVDGKLLTSTPFAFENSAAGAISKLEFQIPSGTAATKFFADNVGLYASYYDQTAPASLSTFESDTTGGAPAGWAISGAGSAVVAEIPHTSPKVLEMATATSAQSVTAGVTLGSALSGDMVLVRFDVILDDSTTTKRAVIYGGGTNKAASLVFVNDGLKAANGSGSLPKIASVENRYVHRGIYRSIDGGATWSDLSNGLPGGSHLSHVRVDPNTATTLYCSDERTNGGLYRKVGSAAWTKLFPTGAISFAKIGAIAAVSRSGVTHLYAGVNGGTSAGLWKSTDGGSTWTQQLNPAMNTTLFPDGLPADLTFSHIETGTGDEVVVASSYGVLRTTNAGTSWAWFNDGIPNASTEFVRTATVDGVKRHYVGMRTEGFGVRYKMPLDVAFKRKSGGTWVNDWRHIPTLARVGTQAYIDAAYQLDALPSAGAVWLCTTSMDDRSDTSSSLLKLQPAVSCQVYVAVPTGATPGWLSAQGFSKQTTTISITERGSTTATTLDVWKATVTSGTVTLGGLKNGGNTLAAVNYLVFLEPN
ncbi:MAG: hypothetical protein HZA32_17335 [Opitutae bacterium]|nr:hypothetical protein [Opitutae bacterium]